MKECSITLTNFPHSRTYTFRVVKIELLSKTWLHDSTTWLRIVPHTNWDEQHSTGNVIGFISQRIMLPSIHKIQRHGTQLPSFLHVGQLLIMYIPTMYTTSAKDLFSPWKLWAPKVKVRSSRLMSNSYSTTWLWSCMPCSLQPCIYYRTLMVRFTDLKRECLTSNTYARLVNLSLQ